MIVKHKYNVTWLPFTSTDDFQSLKPDIVYHKTQNREKRCYKIKKPLFCKLKLRHVYYIMNIFFVLFKLKSDRKIISNYLFYNLYIILIFNFSLIYFIEEYDFEMNIEIYMPMHLDISKHIFANGAMCAMIWRYVVLVLTLKNETKTLLQYYYCCCGRNCQN